MKTILNVLFILITFSSCGQSNDTLILNDSIKQVRVITFELDTPRKGSNGTVVNGGALPNAFLLGYYNYSLYSVKDNRRAIVRDSINLTTLDSILKTTSPDSLSLGIYILGSVKEGKESDEFDRFIKHLSDLGYKRCGIGTDLDFQKH